MMIRKTWHKNKNTCWNTHFNPFLQLFSDKIVQCYTLLTKTVKLLKCHLNQSFLKGPFNEDIYEFPADYTSQNDSSPSAISNVPFCSVLHSFPQGLVSKRWKETCCKGVMHCPTTWWKIPVYVKSGNIQKTAANGFVCVICCFSSMSCNSLFLPNTLRNLIYLKKLKLRNRKWGFVGRNYIRNKTKKAKGEKQRSYDQNWYTVSAPAAIPITVIIHTHSACS
jgi:hypothetical protein